MKMLLTAPLMVAGLMIGHGALAQDATRRGDREKPFRMPARTEANAQTAPAFGAGAGAGADAGGEEKSFRLLTVKHVYVGGIAALFKEAKTISTQPFVSPMTAGGGGGGGGGFGGQGGQGGFGGGQGGFGGGQGGFGGGQGGFGGGQGGFGGGQGGFGGGQGGFGGGNQGFGRRF